MPHNNNNNNNKYDFVLNSLFLLLVICIFLFDTCMFSIYELFAIIIINITHYFCTTHLHTTKTTTNNYTNTKFHSNLNLKKTSTKCKFFSLASK